MKNKIYLMRCISGLVLLPLLTMCTKNINRIDVSNGSSAVESKPVTMAADPTTSCTYTVNPSEWFVDGTGLAPGAVICIPAGTRGALLLKNLKGTAGNPIIVINKGGQVVFSTDVTASYGFKTQNCQYFKIAGNGVATIKYGFVVNGGNIGMTMDDLSSDFEISNVEVKNSGFAGIMAKTDPTCDIATQRGHFTMRNIVLHNNFVHKTGGEGFYIGNSFYAEGRSFACGTVLPHDVINVKLYNNITDSTGCEGIQVGSATSGADIHNNNVTNPGISPFASGQNNGIQIGEGTGGKCYNNLVKNAPGDGIIVLGLGDNLVYNNYILNAGAYGIFADSRYTPGPNFKFINNTIINPGLDGIKLNSESIPMNTVINNVMILRGGALGIRTMSTAVKLTALNNYVSTDLGTCKFVNYNGGNYRLLATSPLIDKGADVASFGITADYYGTLRPVGGLFDIGAAEYK